MPTVGKTASIGFPLALFDTILRVYCPLPYALN